LILIISFYAWKLRNEANVPVKGALALLPLVLFQGALGAWTVTELVKPAIVTAHLFGGLSIAVLCGWVWLRFDAAHIRVTPLAAALKPWVLAGFVLLAGQIFLGGWTSTNYAALACPDFPTCQQSWWPNMDFREAFVLWRGLGIDYEGGVLDHPARVAIHFSHRIGAVIVGVYLAVLGVYALRRLPSSAPGLILLVTLAAQIALGISNVVFGLPLWVATLHTVTAALLLLALINLLHHLTPSSR
jgi:heme a synthase